MISIKEITNLVALKQEGEYWDFKKEWYKNIVISLTLIALDCVDNATSKRQKGFKTLIL